MHKRILKKFSAKFSLLATIQNGLSRLTGMKRRATVLSSAMAAGGATAADTLISRRFGNTAASFAEACITTGSLLLYSRFRPKHRIPLRNTLLTGALIGIGGWFMRTLNPEE